MSSRGTDWSCEHGAGRTRRPLEKSIVLVAEMM